MSEYWKKASLKSVLGELEKHEKDAIGFVLINPDVLRRAAELLRANAPKD